jgi:hypothetical protein
VKTSQIFILTHCRLDENHRTSRQRRDTFSKSSQDFENPTGKKIPQDCQLGHFFKIFSEKMAKMTKKRTFFDPPKNP